MISQTITEEIFALISNADYDGLLDLRSELYYFLAMAEVKAKQLNNDHQSVEIISKENQSHKTQ